MRRTGSLLLLVVSCSACGWGTRRGDEDSRPPPRAGWISVDPSESDAELVNPERGFLIGMDLLAPDEAARVRADGHSLALTIVRLDAYRGQPLDPALLAAIDRGFGAARAAGIKLVLRFSYNAAYQADAPKAQILAHIAQLAPIIATNADVIAVLQAGFIGAWGEWHHSTNGLDNDRDRGDILKALLEILPPERAVQVRRPMFKASLFPGGPLAPAEAFSGTPRARVGHHNDCFLAGRSDSGTYARPVSTWKDYVAAEGRFTPIGGETCTVSRKTDCGPAIAEMVRTHWSFLNQQHDEKVVAEWRVNGCLREIASRLGYRIVVKHVTHVASVAPGGRLDLELELVNRGFAAPFNPRDVYVVLRGQGVRQVSRLASVDLRRWAPDEVIQISAQVPIPAGAKPGSYEVALWLPDQAEDLRPDPRYAIRLANQGMWDDTTGDNVLSRNLQIVPAR